MKHIKETKSVVYTHFNPEQIKKIKILLLEDEITVQNYLEFDFKSELLVKYLNDSNTPKELKEKLLELSLTDKYDSDTRRRIKIDVDIDSELINKINKIKHIKDKTKQNEFSYMCNNFNFVRVLSNLTHLNCEIKNKEITSIDLFPLSNIKSIGNGFLG